MDNQDSSDYHNFSQVSSPAHRLPTLNGAQALFDAAEKHKPISTGLAGLDATLCSTNDVLSCDGGIPRGRLTEIYGAPGCGKTHLAIQLSVNALRDDDGTRVVWIDTSSQLPHARLKQFLEEPRQIPNGDTPVVNGTTGHDETSADERFEHFYISSFPHLLAVLLSPTPEFLPEGTSLLVIDGFSNVTLMGMPQNEKAGNAPTTNGHPSRDDIISKSIATRRAAMLSTISSGLARLAASHNIAVLVINQTSSHRKQGGKNSVLRSALNVPQWNENVSTRIVIYRDFWPAVEWTSLSREEARKQRIRQKWPLRIAEVERLNGKEVSAEGTKFVILKVSLSKTFVDRTNHVQNRLHVVEPLKPVTITNVILSSSPPLPGEDNEEAMGNLGLEDAEEVEDQSLRMPEDMAPSSSAVNEPKPAKRKIDEVADSEDEDEVEIGSAARMPHVSRGLGGFMPSSQVGQDDVEDDVEDGVSHLPDRLTVTNEDDAVHEQDNDMLLQD